MKLFGKITVREKEKIIYELNIRTKNEIKKKEITDYYIDFIINITKWMEEGLKFE